MAEYTPMAGQHLIRRLELMYAHVHTGPYSTFSPPCCYSLLTQLHRWTGTLTTVIEPFFIISTSIRNAQLVSLVRARVPTNEMSADGVSTDGNSGSKFRQIAPAPPEFDPNRERPPSERDGPARRVFVKNACTTVSTLWTY